MQSKGCLLVSRNDLFGARMLPFVNALRIGYDYDIPVKIYWPVPPEGTTNIGEHAEVFDSAFLERHFISQDEYRQLSQQAVALAQVRNAPAAEIVEMVNQGRILALHSSQVAMTLGGEKGQVVKKSYRATLDRITFTPLVTQNIAKINAITKGQKMLAYHVRHGDVTTSYRAKNKPWVNKFTPSEFYVHHYENYGQRQDAKALLFGDFKPSLDWLCAQCPDLIRISDVIDLKELGSLQRDFLELYAMSRADTILGPRSSGFSQLAASLGGVDFRDIAKDMKRKDYEVIYVKLYDRLTNDPESFSSFGETAQCLAHLVPYLYGKGEIAKVAELLEREIERGNEISYLFSLCADACFKTGKLNEVLSLRHRSLSVPMFDPTSIADVDGLAAQAAVQMGDINEALRLLNFAAFQTPYSPQLQVAFAQLDAKGTITDASFYPIDRALMNVLQPGVSAFQPVFFAWEWRHSLISNFQRPLTHAGAADRLLTTTQKKFAKAPRSSALTASYLSFKSVVRMGQGFQDDAFELSMEAVEMAPRNHHVLRRHIQNLIQARNPQAALPFCQELCAIAPEVPIYQTLLATVHLNLKQREKAMEAIDQSQIHGLRFPAITLRQANAFLLMKQPEKAEALLETVLPEIRWPDQYLDALTTTKIELNRQDDIMPMLLKLQKEAGATRNISHLVAKVRRANGDLAGAARDAEFALNYGQNLNQYKVLLVRIYQEMNRNEEANALIAQLPPMTQKRFLRR
jgi:predicted Zn-dependent protease